MKTIEEEIRQKKFANIYTKTDINLLFTAGWLQNFFTRLFKPYGISQQQYNVLRILRGQYPDAIMLSQITERMIDKMSNATRLVEKLRQKGLVTRELNHHSRRKVDIRITEAGLKLLDQLDVLLREDTPPDRYKGINRQDLELLNTILDKMRN